MNAPFASAKAQQKILCVLGPTNTGKTHLAVERMLGHRTGIIGLPLRLLAREIYDRCVALKGPRAVALVTGEEKILPERAQWFVCTVEAMPLDRAYDFLAIDEIQLCADAERGHVFTDRLLHARGTAETMFLGADTVRGLIRRLVPDAEFIARPRLSSLEYAGPKKLSRLPRRSAVVAFSANDVYAIAELVRRQRGGAAVVLGALSPRARNAQVALFQNRDVDVMVATDAIGMGLNLDIEHMAFAERKKFDGVGIRPLTAAETGQIAGRAGRHLRNGTFGTTADCEPFEPEMVEKVEHHRFDPVNAARWRNSRLDFRSVAQLLQSLETPPPREGLLRAREADDLLTLRSLSQDREVTDRAGGRDRVALLWQVCEIPDFRKGLHDSHAQLLKRIFLHLCERDGKLPRDWVDGQLRQIDRTEGDIDTLAMRLSAIRTWTYVAHRGGWLEDPAHWQERARAIEDRLSDALHERLTQRFVDRRAAVLTKHLRDPKTLSVRIAEDDALMVEGETIGHIRGLRFKQAGHETSEEERALRAAAHRSLGPALEERAREIAAMDNARFGLSGEGAVLLKDDAQHEHGVPLALLQKGPTALEPRLQLLADETLSAEMRKAVEARLQQWLAAHLRQHLSDLYRLKDNEQLKGAGRGIAFQLSDALGALPREELNDLLRSMDQAQRHPLRKIGVVFGETHIFLPKLLKPKPAQLKTLLWSIHHGKSVEAPPTPGLTSMAILEPRPEGWWLAAGFILAGNRAYRLDVAQRIAEAARKAEQDSRHPPAPKVAAPQADAKPEPEKEEAVAAIEAAEEIEMPGEISVDDLPEAAEPPAVETETPTPQAQPQRPPRGDGSFPVAVEWMNLAGCGAEDMRALLMKLGFRPVTRKKDDGTPEERYLRSGKMIQAKREREQERRKRDEAKIADSPFAVLQKLKQR